MQCKACGSHEVQKLAGELTASFPNFKSVNIPPVYCSQEFSVCLACGFAELCIPARELELLKKNREVLGSKSG